MSSLGDDLKRLESVAASFDDGRGYGDIPKTKKQVIVNNVHIELSYADYPDKPVAQMTYNSETKTWAITGIPLYPRFVQLLTTLNDFIHSNNRGSRKVDWIDGHKGKETT